MKKKVIARLFINEDCRDAFKKHAVELVQKSRSEADCLVYNLFQDVLNEEEFVFLEEYKDEIALDAHFNSEHLNRFVEDIQTLQSKEMIVEII